ncbi:MAG: hypothetical protein AABX29_04515 [Nanoarchaeota archaeon]
MSDEYACPMMNKCGLYKNENPIFSGKKSPFRGIDSPGEEPSSRTQDILDTHYRSACEGAMGVPCFKGCQLYDLLIDDDLGLSEVFPGSDEIDSDDEGSEDLGLERMTVGVVREDGHGRVSTKPDSSRSRDMLGGKILNGVFRCF